MTAIQGCFANYKLFPSRAVTQIIIEVDIKQTDRALAALGGTPQPEESRWVEISLVTAGADRPSNPADTLGSDTSKAITPSPATKPKRKWSEYSYAERAGILCATPDFQHWIGAIDAESAADRLRGECRVRSRREIDGSVEAREFFEAMHYRYINRNQPPPHTEPR